MRKHDLTPCDMSVCGADNANIKVLGALLVEFAYKNTALKSKQVVYICDGVGGALLSLEACIDLGLVSDNFPNNAVGGECHAAQTGKKDGCSCILRTGSKTIMPHQPLTAVSASLYLRCMVSP